MKRIVAELPDDLASTLQRLAQELGIAEKEIIIQSLTAYLKMLFQAKKLQAIGFGMWRDRADMKDASRWVKKLRETEWQA